MKAESVVLRVARSASATWANLVLRSLLLALAGLLPMQQACAQLVPIEQNVVKVSPGSSQAGMVVKLTASRLAPNRRIDFVLVGRPEIALGSVNSDSSGNAALGATVPPVPAARYRVEAKEGTTVRATGYLTVLASLGVVPETTSPRAGMSLQVRVDRLRAGSLALEYAGERVLGPIAVPDGSKTVKFVLPTDRPVSLPANVILKAVNTVGRYSVNAGQVTLAVQRPRDASPFSLVGATLPSTPIQRGARFQVRGTVDGDDDLPPGTNLDFYYRDSLGQVSALGEGVTDAQGGFDLQLNAPGVENMSAYTTREDGTVFGVMSAFDDDDRPVFSIVDVGRYDAPEADQLDLRFDLRGPQGEAIVGAVIELEPIVLPNGFLTPEQRAAKGAPLEINDNTGNWAQFPNQVGHEFARVSQDGTGQLADLIAPGCPIKLNRQRTDETGRARFVLDTTDLDSVAGQECNLNSQGIRVCTRGQARVMVKVYAGHVGYGYLAPANGDYIPHQYELTYRNRIDESGNLDEGGELIDFYPPNNVIATFVRSRTITLGLQRITQPRPLLGDIYVPGLGQTDPLPPSQALTFKPLMAFEPQTFTNNYFAQPFPGPRYRLIFERDPAFGGPVTQATLSFPDHEAGGFTRSFVREFDQSYCGLDGLEKWVVDLPYFRYGTNQSANAIGEILATTSDGSVAKRTLRIPFTTPFDHFFTRSEFNSGAIEDLVFDETGPGQINAVFSNNRPGNSANLPPVNTSNVDLDAMNSSNRNYSGDNRAFNQGASSLSTAFLSDNQQMSARPKGVSDAVAINPGMSANFGSDEFETLLDADLPLFYYVWGVPELAGVEAGADIFFRAQFRQFGTLGPVNNQPGVIYSKTEPKLEGGIDLYIDVDILFDLVDISADLVPLFGLALPTVIENNARNASDSQACVGMSLTLYWEVDLPCLFIDPICNTVEALLNSDNEALIASHEEPENCNYPISGPPFRKGGAGPITTPTRPSRRMAIAFDGEADGDGDGNGNFAYVADDGSLNFATGPVGEFSQDTRYQVTNAVTTEVETIFFAPGRSLLVWVEVDKDYRGNPIQPQPRAAVRELIRSKHIRYRVCEGGDCGPIRDLTAPGAGEGGLAVARCWGGSAGCPADGEVTLSFTRDTSADFYAFRTRIHRATFNGATGLFGSVSVVDSTGINDSHSAVAYVGSTPVIGWAQNNGGHPDKAKNRRFAYRVMDGASPVRVPAGFPLGVSSISLIGSGNQLGVAMTAVEAGKPFVGNRHALHVARSTSLGGGGFTVRKLVDQDGRSILAAAPQLTVDSGGTATVNFRGLGFGPDEYGQSILPGDPIGFSLHVGDLAMAQTDYSATPVQVQAITNDGGGHAGAAFAFDPSSGAVVSAAHFNSTSALRAAQIKSSGDEMQTGKTLGVPLASNGLGVKGGTSGPTLHMAALGPDFAFGPRQPTGLRGTPGANVRVSVDVINRGRPWSPRFLQSAKLVANWNGPASAGREAASVDITALGSNASRRFDLAVPIPSSFGADERHELHLAIVSGTEAVESDDADNRLIIPLNALPVPRGLDTVLMPDARFVQLTWTDPNDARVVGYKVYEIAQDGARRLLGSTPTHGFLDISAQFGEKRTYEVVSYSARGLSSAPSERVAAMPYASLDTSAGEFGDGFEGS